MTKQEFEDFKKFQEENYFRGHWEYENKEFLIGEHDLILTYYGDSLSYEHVDATKINFIFYAAVDFRDIKKMVTNRLSILSALKRIVLKYTGYQKLNND